MDNVFTLTFINILWNCKWTCHIKFNNNSKIQKTHQKTKPEPNPNQTNKKTLTQTKRNRNNPPSKNHKHPLAPHCISFYSLFCTCCSCIMLPMLLDLSDFTIIYIYISFWLIRRDVSHPVVHGTQMSAKLLKVEPTKGMMDFQTWKLHWSVPEQGHKVQIRWQNYQRKH